MELSGYCRGANKNNKIGQLVSKPSTLCWRRAKELVKQGLCDRNGMIAFGRIRERFGNEALRRVSVSVDIFSQSGGQVAEMAEGDEASEHDLVGRRRS